MLENSVGKSPSPQTINFGVCGSIKIGERVGCGRIGERNVIVPNDVVI